MSKFRPPPRIKSVRRHHMDLVEEHRILNGHYKRLMMAKSVIDTSTPRSVYTNPRKKRQMLKKSQANLSRSRSQSPLRPGSRSRSFGSMTKRDSFRPSPSMDNYRKHSPPIKIVVSPFDSLDRSVSRPEINSRRARSFTNLNSTFEIPTSRTSRASVSPKSNTAINPAARKRSISKQYERRYMEGDIADKHFHYFNQPTEPFQPRLLLFNVAESKIAQQRKHYQPPFWKSRLQQMRAAKLGLTEPSPNMDSPEAHNNGILTFNRSMRDDELLSPPEKEHSFGRSSPMVSFRLGRGRISPNTLGHLSPHVARELLFERVYQYNEQDEWRFMKEVTRDIISAQASSERILFHIFSQATKRWREKLPMARMRILLTRLMDDIQAPKYGILSVYVQPEGPEQPRTKDVSTLTMHSDGEIDDESKYDDDEYEDDEGDEAAADSFADEDMEDILQGKNLDHLYEKMEEKERKKVQKAGNSKVRKPEPAKGKGKKKVEKEESLEEVASVNSETARSVQSGSSSEKSSKKKSSSSRSSSSKDSKSSKSVAEASDKKNSESGDETVAQVSDLEEDDDMQRKISSILSNGKSGGGVGKALEKSNGKAMEAKKIPEKKQSVGESSLSSGEFRLDATPPNALSDSDSNVASGRGKITPVSPPSRELSLKSSTSNHDLPVTMTSQQTHKKWLSGQREQSITKLDSPPPPEHQRTSPSLSIGSLLAEEVRQKRESFLKKLEGEKEKTKNGDEMKRGTSAGSSRRSSLSKKDELVNGGRLSNGSVSGKVDTDLENSVSIRTLLGKPKTPEPRTATPPPAPVAPKNGPKEHRKSTDIHHQPSDHSKSTAPAAVKRLSGEDRSDHADKAGIKTPPKPKPRQSLSRSSSAVAQDQSSNNSGNHTNVHKVIKEPRDGQRKSTEEPDHIPTDHHEIIDDNHHKILPSDFTQDQDQDYPTMEKLEDSIAENQDKNLNINSPSEMFEMSEDHRSRRLKNQDRSDSVASGSTTPISDIIKRQMSRQESLKRGIFQRNQSENRESGSVMEKGNRSGSVIRGNSLSGNR